jgi:tetratricopeptide (TPR) repeat protein
MKKHIILLLLTVASLRGFAEEKDSSALKIFNVGLQFYKAGKLDTAAAIWTYIVEKKVGVNSDVYGNAFFNIPSVYWQLKQYDRAKEWYKKILASDLKDNEETGSLMEPHTNYKHRSAGGLAGLAMLDSNYAEVLAWLWQADTVYRYWGFEGSATNVSQEQAYLLDWKADVLLKMGKKDEAIREIVTELICAGSLEHFFKKSQEQLKKLIDSKFKEELEKSVKASEVTIVDDNNWSATFVLRGLTYTIPISKVIPDRNVPHYWRRLFIYEKDQKIDADYLLKQVRSREFYKSL